VSGSYAYVADWYGGGGIRVINVADPAKPQLVTFYDTPGSQRAVATLGNYMYTTSDSSGLYMADITNPSSPQQVGAFDTIANANGIAAAGSYVYVADGSSGLAILYYGDQPPNPSSYTISGQIRDASNNPIANVLVSSSSGASATTDANGAYTLSGLAAGTYILTPSKAGLSFEPVSRTISVPPSATGQDFTTPVSTYTISGRLLDTNANPLARAIVSDGAGNTATTGTDGTYTLTGLVAGSYTLRPQKAGYRFTPASRNITLPPDASEQNFAARTSQLFLPLSMRSSVVLCDAYEPNDNRFNDQVYGPLFSGLPYRAEICEDDEDDNYYLETTTVAPIQLSLELSDNLVNHASIWLYEQSNLDKPFCGTGPVTANTYRVLCPILSPGRYIVRVYPDIFRPGYTYTLYVTYT
jgi:hypothetical protein